MPQPVQYPFTQIQPDAGGLFVRAAVVAGVALFKHPRQVLRRDAHAGVRDDQSLPLGENADTARAGVFQGVGENLLDHKAEPLLVGQHLQGRALVFQTDSFPDKLLCVFPHALADDVIQGAGSEHKIRAVAVQTQVVQHHLHILLHPEKLPLDLHSAVFRLCLQNQPHGGDGGLDLVGPEGKIVLHVAHAQVHGAGLPLLFLPQGPDQLPVVLLDEVFRRGQLLVADADAFQRVGELPVA